MWEFGFLEVVKWKLFMRAIFLQACFLSIDGFQCRSTPPNPLYTRRTAVKFHFNISFMLILHQTQKKIICSFSWCTVGPLSSLFCVESLLGQNSIIHTAPPFVQLTKFSIALYPCFSPPQLSAPVTWHCTPFWLCPKTFAHRPPTAFYLPLPIRTTG